MYCSTRSIHKVHRDLFFDHMRDVFIRLILYVQDWGFGVERAGPPFCIFHGREGDEWEIEFCLPVDRPIGEMYIFNTKYTNRELPQMMHSTTVYGPYGRAFDRAHDMLKEKNSSEQRIEQYEIGPFETMEEEEFVTHVMVPKEVV